MAKSVQVCIPLEFFNEKAVQMTHEEVGLYFTRLYARAVNGRTELLKGLSVKQFLADFPWLVKKLEELELIEVFGDQICVLHCAENHKRLDFGGVKAKAEKEQPTTVPSQLAALDQLNTNADLCDRWDALLKSWQQTYPQVRIQQELVKANDWLTNNPKKKRPHKARFLAGWFRRAQGNAERKLSYAGADAPRSDWKGFE